MASLANQTISSTYDGLVKTSTDQPVPISGVQLLEDGVGNSLALSVGRANQGVTITGTLTATSISGVLADGVTATTQSSGDNSTKVATTAYVDAQVTASDLDFAGDSGTGAVDLDSQSLTIAGTANEIETSASGQTITIGLPSSVTVGTLTATTLAGTLSTAAQTNITSVGTLSSLTVSGNLTVDTNTLFVDAANNYVGIGTTSPVSNLQVGDGTGLQQVYVSGGGYDLTLGASGGGFLGFTSQNISVILNTASVPLGIGTNASQPLILGTAATERMRIDSSGNVGIGGTPSHLLDIQSTSPVLRIKNTTAPTAGGTSSLLFEGINNFSGVSQSFINSIQAGNSGSTQLVFGTSGSTDATATERMRIDSSGRVGIGESAPLGDLHIKSEDTGVTSVSAQGSNLVIEGSENGMSILSSTAGAGYINFGDSDDNNVGMIIYGHSSNNMSFWTNASKRMTIDASGNVGIGTSSPSAAGASYTGLDIRGSGGGSIRYGVTSGFNMLTYATGTATDFVPSAASDIRFFNKTGVTESIRFQSGGGISFNGDTAAANALDDYEEGTWTMGVSFDFAAVGVTYSLNTGRYTKVGNKVTVTGFMQMTSKGSSIGIARITGLPYIVSGSTGDYAAAAIRPDKVAFNNIPAGWAEVNTTTVTLQEMTSNGSGTQLLDSDFNNDSSILIGLTYFTP